MLQLLVGAASSSMSMWVKCELPAIEQLDYLREGRPSPGEPYQSVGLDGLDNLMQVRGFDVAGLPCHHKLVLWQLVTPVFGHQPLGIHRPDALHWACGVQ